jgi:hypothetical protein
MMKNFLLTAVVCINSTLLFAQTKFQTITHQSADGKYTYTTVTNDPLQVRTYVLKNGLTVMLSPNNK